MTNEKEQTVVTVDIHIKHLGTKSIRKGVGEGIRLPRHEYEVTLTVPEGERYEGTSQQCGRKYPNAISKQSASTMRLLKSGLRATFSFHTTPLHRYADVLMWWNGGLSAIINPILTRTLVKSPYHNPLAQTLNNS